jgi:signal transduction histidine kinase
MAKSTFRFPTGIMARLLLESNRNFGIFLRRQHNGIGIDPTIADRGKDGHFGLQGMRERAARISGNLTLGSSSNLGTEIKLVVPGDIIFRKTTPVRGTVVRKIKALLKRISLISNVD